MDSIIIAHVVRGGKRRETNDFLCKIAFEKDYDFLIRLKFMDSMMERIGFVIKRRL